MLQTCFRKSAVIGRLGGDEFAVLAFDEMDVEEPVIRARIEQSLTQANAQQSANYGVGLSVGTLRCDMSLAHLAIEDLLARADSLMYDQKRLHRHRCPPREGVLPAGVPPPGLAIFSEGEEPTLCGLNA